MSERVPVGGPYRAAIGMHESLNLEHLEEARRLISNYCRVSMEYCCEILRRLESSGKLIATARLEDLPGDKNYKGLDEGLLRLFLRLRDFYAFYIAGLIALYGEDPIVRINGIVQVDGAILQPGEYARLPLETAAALYVAGLAEPVEATAIKARRGCIGEGEEEKQ